MWNQQFSHCFLKSWIFQGGEKASHLKQKNAKSQRQEWDVREPKSMFLRCKCLWHCGLQTPWLFSATPQRLDSALLWQMNLWSGALKRNKGLGDPRNYFFPFFSLLWLRHPNLITKGYNFPGKRLCWPWVFTTSVVFLLGCTACWNTAKITSEQDIPKASSCKMRTKPASACGQFTSSEEEKATVFWEVINIPGPHCICRLSSTSTTFLGSCKQERVLTAQLIA